MRHFAHRVQLLIHSSLTSVRLPACERPAATPPHHDRAWIDASRADPGPQIVMGGREAIARPVRSAVPTPAQRTTRLKKVRRSGCRDQRGPQCDAPSAAGRSAPRPSIGSGRIGPKINAFTGIILSVNLDFLLIYYRCEARHIGCGVRVARHLFEVVPGRWPFCPVRPRGRAPASLRRAPGPLPFPGLNVRSLNGSP